MKTLQYVESVHEQREFNKRVIPSKGDWLEVGKFTRVIETFDIKERYECVDRVGDNNKIVVTLKKLDFEKQENKKKKYVDEILSKHSDLLVASLLKVVVKGAWLFRSDIEDFKARAKLINRPEEYEKFRYKKGLQDSINILEERIMKRERTLEGMKKTLDEHKKLMGEFDGQGNSEGCVKVVSGE